MRVFPSELVLVAGVSNVKVISVSLQGEESLGINLEDLEGGVDLEPGGDRPRPEVNTSGLVSLDAVGNVHDLVVNVTIDGPADNVLIAVEDGAESSRPLVKAVSITWRVVSHEHGNLTLSFKLCKSSVEPVKNLTRVITLRHQVEVHIVASFGVDNDDIHAFNVLKVAIGILCSEALAVVTVFGIDSLSLLIEVLIPELEVVGNHGVLLGEVLRIGLDEVVVALKRIQGIGGQICLEELGKTALQGAHILQGLSVLVVRSHIATPENDIGLDFSVDNLSHCGNNVNGDIAAEGTKRTSLFGGISWKTI
jgi:hypothetical protein